MVERLKRTLTKYKKIAGLEAHINADGQQIFNLIILKLHKELLLKEASYKAINLNEINNKIGIDTPLIFCITGKSVMTKKVNINSSKKEEALNAVMPNAKSKDFIVQISDQNSGNSIVSVVRSNIVNQLIDTINSNSVYITQLYIGYSIVNDLSQLLKENTILFSFNNQIKINNNREIESITSNTSDQIITNQISEENIESFELIGYLSALNFLLNPSEIKDQRLSNVTFNYEQWEYRLIFRKLGIIALSFFFVVLLINTIIFIKVNDEHNELSEQATISSNLLSNLESLQNDLEQKSAFVEELGWLRSGKISFIADRLGASVPETIKLISLNIYPPDKDLLQTQDKLYFLRRRVYIMGECNDPAELNKWLFSLKKLKWVAKIEEKKYNYDQIDNIGKFSFKIIIKNN